MADKYLYTNVRANTPETVLVAGQINVGADGFTGTTSPLPQQVSSLVHNSTGNYTLFFKTVWPQLLSVEIDPLIPASASPNLLAVQIDSHNIGQSGTSDGQQGITFRLYTIAATPALANLPANSGLLFRVTFKNSSL